MGTPSKTEIEILPFFHVTDTVLFDKFVQKVGALPKGSTLFFEVTPNALALMRMIRAGVPPSEIEGFFTGLRGLNST